MGLSWHTSGINLCWTDPSQLSAHPAPPAAATAQGLVETRREQPLTMFLKHICLLSILKSGSDKLRDQLEKKRKSSIHKAGYSSKAVGSWPDRQLNYSEGTDKELYFFFLLLFYPVTLWLWIHDHWLYDFTLSITVRLRAGTIRVTFFHLLMPYTKYKHFL